MENADSTALNAARAEEISALEHAVRKDASYAPLASFERFSTRHQCKHPQSLPDDITAAYLIYLRKIAWFIREDEISALEKALSQVPCLEGSLEYLARNQPKPWPGPGSPLRDTDPDAIYLKFLRHLDQVRQADGRSWWNLLNT